MNGIGQPLAHRLASAARHYESCSLCEHRCAVRRNRGERGVCKAGATARLFRHRVEYGEEPQLVPSHLFYLSGCDLRCAFCIAEANAFDPSRGNELTSAVFQDAVAWGRGQGARNVQWVGGEPTIHLPAILNVMADCDTLPPIVWKSDFYGTPEAFSLLEGVVDTYVADFKFGNNACARRIASVENYVAVITRNLYAAARQGSLIVRHLLLPGHFDCCFRPVVKWMQTCLPDTAFSLRDGYLPKWRAQHFEDLAGRVSREDAQRAAELARHAGLNLVI
jgi:putative pyruvate formate lyase activating enzyme